MIGYRVAVAGDDEHSARVVVRDAGGAEVARADGAQGTVRIEGVQLWRPGAGGDGRRQAARRARHPAAPRCQVRMGTAAYTGVETGRLG